MVTCWAREVIRHQQRQAVGAGPGSPFPSFVQSEHLDSASKAARAAVHAALASSSPKAQADGNNPSAIQHQRRQACQQRRARLLQQGPLAMRKQPCYGIVGFLGVHQLELWETEIVCLRATRGRLERAVSTR